MDILYVSDLHIAHPHTKTTDVLDFIRVIKTQHQHVDYIIFAGDQFHQILMWDNPEVPQITDAFLSLAKFTAIHGIKIIIMKGTPSHDGDQNASIYSAISEVADVTYVDTPTEMMLDNYKFFFYPDPGMQEPEEVLHFLSEKLDGVDVLVSHMAYDYNAGRWKAVNEKQVVSLVKLGLISGHIHQHAIIEHDDKFICSIGSYERLEFATTTDVGMVAMTLSELHKPILKHLVNKRATNYVTIYQDVFDASVIEPYYKGLNFNGYFRFRLKTTPNDVDVSEARTKYKCSIRIEADTAEDEPVLLIEDNSIVLEPSTIKSVLLQHTDLVDNTLAQKHLDDAATI